VLKTRITRPSLGVLIRVVADAILIQVSLIGALAVRFYTIIAFQGVGEYTVHQLLQMYQGWYMRTAIPLTALCLMIFSGIGFYTRGPYYQNRYKVLVVIQAVTASFVLYAFIVLFFEIYGGDLAFAKIALALAWLFSIALLAGARVWNQVWQRTAEAPIAVKRDGPPQVLVIGGAGYIGSALVPKLLDAGYRVSVLDMLLFGDSSLAEVRNHERLEVIKGDFRHADKVFLAMRNVEAVVHLGAIVGDPACSIDENVTIDFNLIGTRIRVFRFPGSFSPVRARCTVPVTRSWTSDPRCVPFRCTAARSTHRNRFYVLCPMPFFAPPSFVSPRFTGCRAGHGLIWS
jgi:FlaA1/EpsC-like NDP-sugar epimerase